MAKHKAKRAKRGCRKVPIRASCCRLPNGKIRCKVRAKDKTLKFSLFRVGSRRKKRSQEPRRIRAVVRLPDLMLPPGESHGYHGFED